MAASAAALFAGSAAYAGGNQRPAVHLENSPLSSGVLMARAIRSGAIRLPAGIAAGHTAALNCKPAPCTLPNVQASEGGQPVDETPISVDPNNAKHVLTAGNDYNCGSSLQG